MIQPSYLYRPLVDRVVLELPAASFMSMYRHRKPSVEVIKVQGMSRRLIVVLGSENGS